MAKSLCSTLGVVAAYVMWLANNKSSFLALISSGGILITDGINRIFLYPLYHSDSRSTDACCTGT